MPIRKYGFHGLSYASIVSSLAKYLKKPEEKVNIVVAHLGSGASSCCIKGGKSIDTSRCLSTDIRADGGGMGLTPLEGLIGGTRSGTIDPTAIFHAITDPAGDAGIEGMKVSKAEATLNK
jgi:acetate kinase